MKKLLLGIILIFFPLIASAQDEVLTNQSITDMLELGFSNDVIVTKINTSKNNFDTSIQALKELKEKGVSNDIIVAMMQRNKRSEDKEAREQSIKTGIYFKENDGFKKIFPAAISNAKTNTLGSKVTPHITNTKIKSVLSNEHSTNIIETNIPDFRFFFNNTKQMENTSKASNWRFTVASSPHEFVLVKLISKKGKRELKTGEIDLYSGNFAGVESKDIVICNIEVINETEFRVTPQTPILPGEYCFLYQGTTPHSYNNSQAVFDFSIPENCKIENKYKIDDSVWVLKDGKTKKLEVMSVNIKNDGIYYSLRARSSWKDEEYKESDCYPSKEAVPAQ